MLSLRRINVKTIDYQSIYNIIMSVYNILIVDDHPIVREGIKVVLSRIDGVVCTLCDSVEQLANMLSRNANYDLYVLDL